MGGCQGEDKERSMESWNERVEGGKIFNITIISKEYTKRYSTCMGGWK